MENFSRSNKMPVWKRVFFSPNLLAKNGSQKIAFVAITTAFIVMANMFFEIKFADIQFSFTILFSCVVGILLGGAFGFVACFLGDLVGFLYHSGGYMYMPWIGLSMGLTAFIAGAIVNGISSNTKTFLYVKLFMVCIFSFLICTVAINTTAFWLLYSKTDYFTYLVTRIFIQGQIWNSLINYVLLFITVPILNKIKPLKLNIN